MHREALIWASKTLDLDVLADDFDLEKKLADYLNDLVAKDFNRLISILYRIDISQEKAVTALAENSDKESAGETMARLIINRQKEKLHFRESYKNK